MTRSLVVCGLSETMLTLVPSIWLIRVDLPAFGRPTKVTKPDFIRLPRGGRRSDVSADCGSL